MLCPVGIQWLSKLLNKMDAWLDHPTEIHFELSTSFFNHWIAQDLQSRLFGELAAPNEPISPSQTTFLKILDAYLANPESPTGRPREEGHMPSSNGFLIPVFQLLAAYASTSIKHVPDDARLPKVFEGLVLVSEALISIGLAVQKSQDSSVTGETHPEMVLVEEMKSPDDGEGLVKPIIGKLSRFGEVLMGRNNPSAK